MNALLKRNLISTKEASELSGYNADYLSRLCRAGRIDGEQVGRTWLIERDALTVFIAEQAARKIELAENLARTRSEEYRKANLDVVPEIMTASMEQRTKEAVNSVMKALLSVRLPRPEVFFEGRKASYALTAFVISAGVLIAGSGLVSATGSSLMTAAFEGRALAIERTTDALVYATAKRDAALARIEIESSTQSFVMNDENAIDNLALAIVTGMNKARMQDAFDASARVREASEMPILAISTEPLTEETLRVVVEEKEIAYALGDDTILGNYAVSQLETYQGRSVLATAGGSLFTLGDTILTGIASFITSTPSTYENAIIAFVDGSASAGSIVSDTSFALGNDTRKNATLAVSSLVSGTINQSLGVAGTIALYIESAPESQQASPLAALDFGRFIPSLFENVRSFFARLIGSDTQLAVVGTEDETSLPVPGGTRGNGTAPADAYSTTTIVQNTINNNGPVTVVNEYQGLAGGVSQSYVDTQLWMLQDRLNRGTDKSKRTSRSLTSIDNLTGTNLTLNNSVFNGGNVRALSVEAAEYIAGPYVLATSTTATFCVLRKHCRRAQCHTGHHCQRPTHGEQSDCVESCAISK